MTEWISYCSAFFNERLNLLSSMPLIQNNLLPQAMHVFLPICGVANASHSKEYDAIVANASRFPHSAAVLSSGVDNSSPKQSRALHFVARQTFANTNQLVQQVVPLCQTDHIVDPSQR